MQKLEISESLNNSPNLSISQSLKINYPHTLLWVLFLVIHLNTLYLETRFLTKNRIFGFQEKFFGLLLINSIATSLKRLFWLIKTSKPSLICNTTIFCITRTNLKETLIIESLPNSHLWINNSKTRSIKASKILLLEHFNLTMMKEWKQMKLQTNSTISKEI